jgi:sporulation lipoprotein, YhcN/YlaJ family
MIKRLRPAAVLLAALLAGGCGNYAQNDASPSPQNNASYEAQQNDAAPGRPGGRAEMAARLEQLAMSVEGVNNAHCVVIGQTAVVGIDVDPALERSRVGTIKYSVAEALRKDYDGMNALVTADIDIAQRLGEMGEDIRNGRPIAGFVEEMADIIGRIIPQVPRDIAPPAR